MGNVDAVDFRAYDLIDDAVIVAQAGLVVYLNEFCAQLIGNSVQSYLGVAVDTLLGLSSDNQSQLQLTGRLRIRRPHSSGEIEWALRRSVPETVVATGRVITPDHLDESERRFQALFNAAPYSCSLTDQHGRFVLVNDAFSQLSGFDASEVLGKSVAELGILQPLMETKWTDVLRREGHLDRVEISTESREGRLRHLLISALPLALGGNRHSMSVTVDITDRKLAEEALARSERRFRLMIQYFNDIMVIVDREGFIRFVSPACERILGFTPQEMLNVRATSYVHSEDAQAVTKALTSLILGQTDSEVMEFRHLHRDGTFRWLEVSATSLLADPEIEGMVMALRDVTRRRESDNEIAAWKNRYDLISQAAGQVAYDYEISGPVAWSGVVQDLLGYEPQEMLGGVSQWEERLHPEDRARVMDALNCAKEKAGRFRSEYRIARKDGSYVMVEECGYPYCNNSGRLLGYIGVILDISERKASEELRLRLEENLRQAQKMEAVGRLAGGVAHDFNNLLTVIGGSIALAGLSPMEEQGELFQDALKAVDSAASLTRQLLAFSRKQIIAPQVLNLNDVMLHLHRMLIRLIGEDIEMQSIPCADLGMTRIDPGQVDQILVNLCVNARDAMPNGGKLTIETANVFLDASYCSKHPEASPGEYVMIAVSDNGTGMPPDTIRLIFEPFYTTKGKGKGTGLGLAMVYGAVKQNGGSIEVYSEVGQGTTFKIYLPRVDSLPSLLTRDSIRIQSEGGETIVLAEDEELVRVLAVRVLERAGYKVLAYPNAEAALQAIVPSGLAVDLLVTDVVMPGMNGRLLAESLRAHYPKIAVLFTSGYTENVVVHHGVLDANVEFVPKPYAPDVLLRRVREVLALRGTSS